jgi:hypothetical protein
MSARFAAWLVTPDGTRLAIKPTGILMGRAPHCDVVLTEPGASRVQAIVFAGPEGPCLTVLGKGPTAVNGELVTHDRVLEGGDRVELPGLVLEVLAARDETPAPPRSSWVLRGPGGLFGVVRTPFVVGSDAGADLRLEGGPAVALRFHLADRLHVEAVAAIEIDGVACEPGSVEVLRPGATVRYAGGQLSVVSANPLSLDVTDPTPLDEAPTEVRLEFLARGGRLTVGWRGLHRTVYLPERRCDLVATLLQPPPPFAPGEFVSDEVVLPRIWPGRSMTRVDLNVLIHRARHDHVRAEHDGAALLDRAEGGNATRFRIARGARISVD